MPVQSTPSSTTAIHSAGVGNAAGGNGRSSGASSRAAPIWLPVATAAASTPAERRFM